MIDLPGYRAATGGVASIDRSSRGKMMARGADRLSFLQAMLTQDVASLAPGQGCYASLLTARGRMVADMRLYELGESTLAEVAPGLAGLLVERLDGFVFSEDVQLADETGAWALERVVGPRAAEVVPAVLDALGGAPGAPSPDELGRWTQYRAALVEVAGEPAVLAGNREWGLPAFDLFVRADTGAAVRGALASAGAVTLSEAAAEALRIEAGVPEFQVDMTTETNPLEAGIERRAISFTKGCYPGQEVIVRVVQRGGGRVARRLAGLLVEGCAVPERGVRLAVGGEEVGHLTSAAWSPALDRLVALGYVRSELAKPGTALEVLAATGCVPALTAQLPLIAR